MYPCAFSHTYHLVRPWSHSNIYREEMGRIADGIDAQLIERLKRLQTKLSHGNPVYVLELQQDKLKISKYCEDAHISDFPTLLPMDAPRLLLYQFTYQRPSGRFVSSLLVFKYYPHGMFIPSWTRLDGSGASLDDVGVDAITLVKYCTALNILGTKMFINKVRGRACVHTRYGNGLKGCPLLGRSLR